MKQKYYVYTYLNPEVPGQFIYDSIKFDYEPFYVGKGTGKRCYYHIMNASRNIKNNTPFYNKIKELKWKNLLPEIKIIQYFDDEQSAYNFETNLISKIGSNFIFEIKDGPLKNTCLIAQPPNHKGKTYEEIYGIERAVEQKRIRHEKQLAVGGFFKGHKHSIESKNKISQKFKGPTGLNTGKKHSKEFGEAISKAKKGKHLGRECKLSKKYFIYNTITNEKYEAIGQHEINQLAKKFNLSVGTLHKSLYKNKPSVKGKTKGWQLIYQLK